MMKSPPSVHLACPRCEEETLHSAGSRPEGGERRGALSCQACGFTFPGSAGPPDPARPIERCAVCGRSEFYLQKDFNRTLGLAIVVVSAIAAFLVMVVAGHLWGFLVLGAVGLLDLAVYRRLPDVTVCYLCQSVYRGFPPNREHRGFYLQNEERQKGLRQAWLNGLPGLGREPGGGR